MYINNICDELSGYTFCQKTKNLLHYLQIHLPMHCDSVKFLMKQINKLQTWEK